jgi:hypothetical protein
MRLERLRFAAIKRFLPTLGSGADAEPMIYRETAKRTIYVTSDFELRRFTNSRSKDVLFRYDITKSCLLSYT